MLESFLSGETGLWTLFATSFMSSTLLPGGSEVNVIAALRLGSLPAWSIVLVATIGNTLGGITNVVIGRWIPEYAREGTSAFERSKRWLRQYGIYCLLFSWLPIIGDPLCLVAGWMRLRFWWSSVAIFVGKGTRYVVLAWLAT